MKRSFHGLVITLQNRTGETIRIAAPTVRSALVMLWRRGIDPESYIAIRCEDIYTRQEVALVA